MKALIRAVMCDLYPRTDTLPGVEDCDIDQFLEKFQRETTPATWAGVVAGSLAYAAAPAITIGRKVPFTMLTPEERDAHAYAIATTDIYHLRQLTFLVKMVAGLCWGQHPKVRAIMNVAPYSGDPGTFRQD